MAILGPVQASQLPIQHAAARPHVHSTAGPLYPPHYRLALTRLPRLGKKVRPVCHSNPSAAQADKSSGACNLGRGIGLRALVASARARDDPAGRGALGVEPNYTHYFYFLLFGKFKTMAIFSKFITYSSILS